MYGWAKHCSTDFRDVGEKVSNSDSKSRHLEKKLLHKNLRINLKGTKIMIR